MDDERFDSLLMDELYGELDEETSAAMKRYAAANPRAAEKLSGLQDARRAAKQHVADGEVELPPGLEERILARAKEARKVVPFRRKMATTISRAGNWAMRPQTAMAAVFLLMIGSSVLLVRGRHAGEPGASNLTVTEQGEPAGQAPGTDEAQPLDPKAAELAHGTELGAKKVAAASPAAMGSAEPASAPANVAPSEQSASEGVVGGAVAMDDRAADKPTRRAAQKPEAKEEMRADLEKDSKGSADGVGRGWPSGLSGASGGGAAGAAAPSPQNAGAIAGAPSKTSALSGVAQAPAAQAPPQFASPPPPPAAAAAPASPAVASEAKPKATTAYPAGARATNPELDRGIAQYNVRDFAGAQQTFDALAASGDLQGALWAARSTREASGCGVAVGRFDALAQRSFGTAPGYDATLEGGRCHRANGNVDAARARFVRLLTVPSHAARAQAELEALGPAQSSKQAPSKSAPSKKQAPAAGQKYGP